MGISLRSTIFILSHTLARLVVPTQMRSTFPLCSFVDGSFWGATILET